MRGNLDIAVVLPTFNERGNISEVIARLSAALEGLSWELIFIDDDLRPTARLEVVSAFAARRSPHSLDPARWLPAGYLLPPAH